MIESKAVEIAAWTLEQTEIKKKHKKHCKMAKTKCFNFNHKKNDNSKCTCADFKEQLDEGKQSQLITSQSRDRKVERREAVSSKNDTERMLVVETVKTLATSNNLDEMNLL